MRFFAFTLPFLALITANPLPSPESAELAVRQATDALAARTWFEHDWRCSSDKAKSDCKKRGGEWACDKSCVCVEKPKECGTYCPLRDLKKKACELKWGYTFNDDKCSCESTCPDADHKKAECAKQDGKFDLGSCSCAVPKCPFADDKAKECSKKGLGFDKDNCCCATPPPPPPPTCDYTGKAKECTKQGLGFDKANCCCAAPPTPPKCNDWEKQQCKGKWNSDKCTCEKEEDKGTCGDWWQVWLCKLKGKGCDSKCSCY
ncbi:uncharacterized protein MKK02DRAFT_42226 [Dioszegia hungarica]|uniref:Uncharacterized protein n=1 Tax=Dioszegia hungarica TaxID=4972 RepID=A0AA38HCR2_9TREE|nr:uncharacterized protein MKK02DRAFT_42226 [Dioszegia hungarica]KAI9637851.1 hypothetical protein MKK02DRAFT_42226 [Dioszegia hungarica]